MKTYFDSTTCLVPAKLIRRFDSPQGLKMVALETTEARGPYPKGYRLETTASNYVHKTGRAINQMCRAVPA